MIRFRPLLVPTLWFVPGLLLLVGLGAWQLGRLQEKEALIASITAGMKAPPAPLEQALAQGPANAEWHHVEVKGHFLHDKEVYFFAQGMKGAVGVQIITPLVEDDGTTILVNRGFVPDALKDPGSRGAGQVPGEVSLSGVVRVSENPGFFTPKSDPAARLWFVKNVPEMAAFLGVPVKAPIFVEADATPNPGGWPLGGQTNVDVPNDHLQYAITWFGLALALTGVYLVYHHSRGRLTLRP